MLVLDQGVHIAAPSVDRTVAVPEAPAWRRLLEAFRNGVEVARPGRGD